MNESNTTQGFGAAVNKAKSAVSNAAQSTKEKLAQGSQRLGERCTTMEDANYELVRRYPGSSLAVAALAGAAIGYLMSSRSSR
ncbi:hypothetical protein [Chitinimonas sp. BJB300]|uniref:hypothetical protein n=1 Tax=Chitinimonas sp. BJB300 TaxID=1559339 RepID=UPI000C0FC47E|nr:hypothetical protein [Chitinimonas sp. BJB300]PHV09804.1 hypothetical protein CSQ89_19705 [Chitinimonas sp. BJB300]TSJ90158.1 hypothetical protein FG002_008285 [Chitinimonas sp. BJB300]